MAKGPRITGLEVHEFQFEMTDMVQVGTEPQYSPGSRYNRTA